MQRSPKTASSRRWWSPSVLVLALTTLFFPWVGTADPEVEARYPYDPACPWGRISNGKGMLHRCLSESEARKLASDAKSSPPRGSLPENGAAAPEKKIAEPKPTEAPAPVETSVAKVKPVSVQLTSIQAAEGSISIGKLGKPMDRYKQCIEENGGLESSRGTVVVQFLVRAEFGRAEGVEVKRASGVSKKAARCLADVVDRRQVGLPSVPLTGVDLTFEITAAP